MSSFFSLIDKNPQINKQNNAQSNQRQLTASSDYLTSISIGFNKDTGRLLRKIVPANNSCLFTAVYFCISNGKFNPNIGNELRKVIADRVKDDPLFNDAILGCPNKEYRKKIMKDTGKF